MVFLDVNRFTCLFSVIARHGKKRSDLPDYLEEKYMDKEFIEFLKFIWNFSKNGKQRILEMRNKYPDTPFLTLKSRRAVRKQIKLWQTEKQFG